MITTHTNALLSAVAIALVTIRFDLDKDDLTEDVLLEDLDVDPLDRAEMALFIEDNSSGSVSDEELYAWVTLGDIVRTYKEKLK